MIRALAFAVLLNFSLQGNAEDVKPVKDAGPYVPAPQSVVSDMLRHADVGPTDRARMIVQGQVGAVRDLGGESALTPLPKQTPTRLIVLWTVLIGGVALLVAMALQLLKRLQSPGQASQ